MRKAQITFVALVIIAGFAVTANAATWVIPGVAHNPGLQGSFFDSTLWITNYGTVDAHVEFAYIPFRTKPGADPVLRTVPAGATIEFASVVRELFGLADSAGTIVFSSDVTTLVTTTSTVNTADPKGEYGLALRQVPEAALTGSGQTAHVIYASHKANLQGGNRTNIAAVLIDPNTSVTVVVFDPDNREVGRKTITSTTPVHHQESIGAYTGGADLPLGRIEFRVTSGRVATYDSVVDNTTNDGYVIQGTTLESAATRKILPGVAKNPGLQNSYWQSDLFVYNPNPTSLTVTFTGWLNVASTPFTRTIAPNGLLAVKDVIASGFGLAEGQGAIDVTAPNPFLIEACTYNVDRGAGMGIFSSAVMPLALADFIAGPGAATVNAVELSASHRTNVALVTTTGGTFTLRLLDMLGQEVGRTSVQVAANRWFQQRLGLWFGAVPSTFKGRVVVEAPQGATVHGYASRVDNGSNDAIVPVFTATRSCTPPAITSFTAEPTSSVPGADVVLTLASTNCTSAVVTPGNLPIPCNGSVTVNPLASVEYLVTATGDCPPDATARVNVNVNCPPVSVTATAQGSTEFCNGGSVTLVANATNCNQCQYTWYRNGVAYGTTQSITVDQGGNYHVDVKDSANCSATSNTVSVTVRDNPTAFVSGDATICAGNSANITVEFAGVPPFSGSWSDGLPFSTYAYQLTRAVSPSATTTYSIGMIWDAYCSAFADGNATITVAPNPNATITAPAVVSGGASFQASVPSAGAGATYAWSITNGQITAGQGTSTVTITAGPNGSVSISITVVNSAGCSASSSTSVAIDCVPPSAVITAATSTCASSFNNPASVPDAGAGASYAWSITNGTITAGAGTRTITYTAGASGTTQLAVTVTNAGGCVASSTHNVAINSLPDATITPDGPTTFCQGGTVTLQGPAGMSTYTWFKDGAPAGAVTQNFMVSLPGSYVLLVTDSNGCGNMSDPVVVTVNPLPTVNSLSVSPGTIPLGGSATVTFTITNATSWTLSSALGNGFSASSGVGSGTFNIGYDASSDAGTDTVALTTTNSCGATNAEIQVVVTGCGTNGTSISTALRVCANSGNNTATVTSNATMVDITWSVTNGTMTGGQGTPTMTYSAGESGSVYINAVVNFGGGCSYSTGRGVPIDPAPVSTITPDGPTTFCQGGTVTLQGPAGMSTYTWFKDGAPAGAVTQNFMVHQPGSYVLLVTDSNGCGNMSDPVVVVVNPLPSINSLSVSPGTIPLGGSATVTFTITDATSWTLSSSRGNSFSASSGSGSGTFNIGYNADTADGTDTITLTATNGCGSRQSTTTIIVTP